MRAKSCISILLVAVMLLSIVPLAGLKASAAYDYLFPVNNGGAIAYIYGYSDAYGGWHDGIDIHSSGDDTIYAAYDGVVGATADSCWHVSCGYACEHYTTYGNYIRIDQDDGTKAYYGHLLLGSLKVSVGTRVVKGQAIASMGSSGYSTGKHLHFEVRSGSTKINTNPVSNGGSINYTYAGYGNTSSQPTYTDIIPGTYAVKNNYTGTYMCVSYGADNNLQNVDMYSEINAASRMVITKASTGYKMRPECCASRLVNPYGYTVTSGLNVNIYNDENDSTQWWQFQKVSGGYVIRNVQNPDCVLDTDGGNVFVSSYTGASTQIWSLISTHVHSYGSWKTRKAATCSSNGTEYRTCSCGAEETRTTSALGHNYTSVITKPTCTKGGYTTYTCSRCSHSYTGNSTSAKGHTPGSAATCTSAQKCTTCGVTITAAKGHTPGAAATCTNDQTCSTCGEVIDHAKGHDEGKWEILEDGSKERRCIKCGHLLETVPATKPKPDPDIDVALGDVNKDGLIDQFDYILVKRHYFATRLLTDNELLRADINRDEIIDQFDYILIKRIYFGTYTIG